MGNRLHRASVQSTFDLPADSAVGQEQLGLVDERLGAENDGEREAFGVRQLEPWTGHTDHPDFGLLEAAK